MFVNLVKCYSVTHPVKRNVTPPPLMFFPPSQLDRESEVWVDPLLVDQADREMDARDWAARQAVQKLREALESGVGPKRG